MNAALILEVVNPLLIRRVCELAEEIWREHYTPIIGREQVDYMLEKFQSEQSVAAQIQAGCLYYLVKNDQNDVGYFCVQPKRASNELFLSKFYIRAPARGRGYGRIAQDFIEQLARQKGLGKIMLTVNKHNENSIKIYQKMGFEITEAIVQDIGSVFFMDDYRMEKCC